MFCIVLSVICASCLFSVCCVRNVRGVGDLLLVDRLVLCVLIWGVICAVLSFVLGALCGSCGGIYFAFR